MNAQPVSKGSISFEPEDSTTSPVGAKFQADGKYEVHLPPGRYKVQINQLRDPPRDEKKTAPISVAVQPLTKTPQQEEITGPRELNFEFKSD